MTAKKPKPGLLSFLADRNNILILLIIVVIIGVAYFVLTSEEEERVYDIEDINRNSEEYIGETVRVIGYYESNDNTLNAFPDPQDVTNPTLEMLRLDLSNVNLTNTSLADGAEYIFTGELIWNPNNPYAEPSNDVVLVVEKYKRHR